MGQKVLLTTLLITSWNRETVIDCVEGVQVEHEVLGVEAVWHQGLGHLAAPLLHLGPHPSSLQGGGDDAVNPRPEEGHLVVVNDETATEFIGPDRSSKSHNVSPLIAT